MDIGDKPFQQEQQTKDDQDYSASYAAAIFPITPFRVGLALSGGIIHW
jgi:hypothetical protein